MSRRTVIQWNNRCIFHLNECVFSQYFYLTLLLIMHTRPDFVHVHVCWLCFEHISGTLLDCLTMIKGQLRPSFCLGPYCAIVGILLVSVLSNLLWSSRDGWQGGVLKSQGMVVFTPGANLENMAVSLYVLLKLVSMLLSGTKPYFSVVSVVKRASRHYDYSGTVMLIHCQLPRQLCANVDWKKQR